MIHPIAGQGLNMGLKDVAALAEVIVDAVRLGLDPGSLAVLDRYQRWRRFDTMAMGVATEGLNRLFSNRSDVLRLTRDFGLGLVERLPMLKRFFIREAAGLVGEVPKLLKGEALYRDVSRAQRSTERSGVVRCRPGTFTKVECGTVPALRSRPRERRAGQTGWPTRTELSAPAP